jgi:hypothetical protein
MNNMEKFICHICYREFSKNEMKMNASGEVSTQCSRCFDELGGHRGGDRDKTDETWFDSIDERKADLIKRGLIK